MKDFDFGYFGTGDEGLCPVHDRIRAQFQHGQYRQLCVR